MFTFTAQVEVGREPAEIGRFLLDPMRWPEWTDMRDVRVVTAAPSGLGMRARATLGSGPLKSDVTWELTAAEPERLITYQTVSTGRFGMDGTYRLERLAGGRTRVTIDGIVRTRGVLRLLEPLFRSEVRSNEAKELERMKVILEAQASHSETPVQATA
jgi:hypothetical protein